MSDSNLDLKTYFSWTYAGRVDRVEKRLTCPECTKIVRYIPWHDELGSRPVEVIPVFLVKRINKKTGDWFFGCPNFPKCKYSKSRPKTKTEKDREIWSWANSLYNINI